MDLLYSFLAVESYCISDTYEYELTSDLMLQVNSLNDVENWPTLGGAVGTEVSLRSL